MSQKHDRDAAQSDAAYAGMHPQLAADETWADIAGLEDPMR